MITENPFSKRRRELQRRHLASGFDDEPKDNRLKSKKRNRVYIRLISGRSYESQQVV